MYIISDINQKYCYACETVWGKERKKPRKSGKCIGHIKSDNSLSPNRYLSQLFFLQSSDPSSLNEYEKLVIETVIDKYGEGVTLRRGIARGQYGVPFLLPNIEASSACCRSA